MSDAALVNEEFIRHILDGLPGITPEKVLDEIEKPLMRFSTKAKAQRGDWRNYIPISVAEAWKDLSIETRLIAYTISKWRVLAET